MILHLESKVFDVVKNGGKDIEIRINDEKRRDLKIGDTLIFIKKPLEDEKITAIVKDLIYFKNFDLLVNSFPTKRLYMQEYSKQDILDLLSKFYTIEEQEKYGVVAIVFEKI